MKNDKPVTLLVIIMIIGLILIISFSAVDIINFVKTKEYIKTIGIFVEADYAPTPEDEAQMYFLNYKYSVEGKTYYCQTYYKTSIVPKIGSESEIKYNPEDPSVAYIKGWGNIRIFQMIGIFFFFISLALLCNKEITRNISIFMWSSSIIIYFIYWGLYQSVTGIIFMIIPFIINIACIMSFIGFVKSNAEKEDLEPIENFKQINNDNEYENNKEDYTNLENTEVENKRKNKVILISIVLFCLLPLDIFIDSQGWFLNESMYMACSVISAFSFLLGFFILGIYFTSSTKGKHIISVGGVEIRNDYIENASVSTKEIEEKRKELKKNVIITFIRSSLFLPFIIIFLFWGKDASEAEKAGMYTFFIFFTIILYLPVLFHFVKYIKFKQLNKRD